jgi:hypothetical protein
MEKVLDHVERQALSPEIVRKDRAAASLEAIAGRNETRDASILEAYSSGAYTITEIAEFWHAPVNCKSGGLCMLHVLTPLTG